MRSMLIDLEQLGDPIDISIPLRFNGPQPNAYGIQPASSKACDAADIIGDKRRGGSVNFERVSLIPHCNGTHTGCVGHITNERISVRDCLLDAFMQAVLVSVAPENVAGELFLTQARLINAIEALTYVRATDTVTKISL